MLSWLSSPAAIVDYELSVTVPPRTTADIN